MKRQILAWLYQHFFKPMVFRYDAEVIHNLMTDFGQKLGESSLGRAMTFWVFGLRQQSLRRTLDGIYFPNPVGLSAGFDYEAKLTQIVGPLGFGFATIGTVTLHPYQGNQKPRLARFPRSQALLVNKGFKSPGALAIIEKLSGLRFSIPIGISIGSTNQEFPSLKDQIKDIDDCFQLFERSELQHSYYELNISCPNTKVGQPFANPQNLKQLLEKLQKRKISRPVYLKMPIDLGEQKTLALLKIAEEFFVSGVIFGNLTKDKLNPAVDVQDRIRWQRSLGNLSGKPTWWRSNQLIALTKKHFGNRFTIIGTGGIFSAEDAAEKIKLGADLVQLITGMVYQGPQLVGQISEQLATSRR